MVINSNLAECRTFQELLWNLLMVDGVGDDQAARIIAWALWHNRNEIRHDGKRKTGQALVQQALNYLAEYEAAVEAEEKAFEAGLLFAKDIGIQDVILEGDSMIVYNALCEKSFPLSSVEPVVRGMQEMAKDFRQIEFSDVRRQGKRPAHLLTKHASCIVDYIAWIKENPCIIEQALIKAVISISHME